MKLAEIYYNSEMPTGTYIGVRFDDDTKKRITNLIKKLKLKNPVPEDSLHSTLIYSDKKVLNGFSPKSKIQYKAIPKAFSLFNNSENYGKKCLVIELDCEDLQSRHSDLVNQYDVEETFPDYRPHITLTYDYDEQDVPDASLLDQLGIINIESEYSGPLKKDYIKSL
jgi:2'-5' RNA ligase